MTGPDPTPSALAIALKVPWDQPNDRHEMRVELLDADGHPIVVGPDPEHVNPVVIQSHFEVGRPAGLRPGTPIDLAFAVNVGPMPLPPGGRFEWRLSIDGQTEAHWHAAFSTRPQAEEE